MTENYLFIFSVIFLKPSITSMGIAKTTVFAGLAVVDSMVCKVRREIAPLWESILIALLRFWEAESSTSERMIVALRSRSASACFAMTRFISAGTSISWIFMAVTVG